MKNIVILFVLAFFSISSMSMAHDDARAIGEDMCYGIIDAVSPGSNHVMDCLSLVNKLMASGMSAPEDIINAVCEQAPNFAYSFGGLSEQECLDAAWAAFME